MWPSVPISGGDNLRAVICRVPGALSTLQHTLPASGDRSGLSLSGFSHVGEISHCQWWQLDTAPGPGVLPLPPIRHYLRVWALISANVGEWVEQNCTCCSSTFDTHTLKPLLLLLKSRVVGTYTKHGLDIRDNHKRNLRVAFSDCWLFKGCHWHCSVC